MRRLIRTLFSRQWRTLTAFVTILLVSAFVAAGTGYWLLFRLTYVLALGLPVAYGIAWLNTRALSAVADRKTLRAQVGLRAEELLTVTNRSWFPKLWLEVEDPSDMPGHDSRRVLVIPRKGSQIWWVDTPLVRRGLYRWGPVRIASADPFGIFRIERRFGGEQQILVYPPVVDLPNFHAPPANLPGEGQFRRRTHYITPNASGVREYAPGDPLSRIHWKTTARTGALMVKTFELDPSSDVWVVLGLEERLQAGRGDESTVEYGVRAAASIARHYINANRSVGLMSFGANLDIVEPQRGQQHMSRIFESLAVVRGEGEAPLGNLLGEEQRRFGRHTTLIIITPSGEDAWVTQAQAAAQRGVRLAVVLLDRSTFGEGESALATYSELTASGILSYTLNRGDELSLALSHSGAGEEAWQG